MNTLPITLIGGPTALIEVAGFRLLTDPTFDPPGEYRLPDVMLTKTLGPAITAGWRRHCFIAKLSWRGSQGRRAQRPEQAGACVMSAHGKTRTMTPRFAVTRRRFLTSAMFASTAAVVSSTLHGDEGSDEKQAPKLGLDNFAVRAMGWKAPQLIEYAASIAADSLFITDLDAFESFEAPYLARLRQDAAAKGVQIHVGTWSICPTSKAFKPDWGTAEEHLALAIRAANGVGSPVIRVVLGTWEDRLTDGGIERHMEETAKVCRACRSRAEAGGVKIAIENHAGDMHSTELVRLIEAAGPDYVGANLDSGNALWTLEDPIDSLETIGSHTLTTSLRDSAVWKTEDGANVQWTAMGDGDIDLKAYFTTFRTLCPGVPVHIETISGVSRELPYLQRDFWSAWPSMPAKSFARFVALAERGTPREPWSPPSGSDKTKAEQEYQRAELERSLTYCRDALDLG